MKKNNYLQGLWLMILIEIFMKFRFEWGEKWNLWAHLLKSCNKVVLGNSQTNYLHCFYRKLKINTVFIIITALHISNVIYYYCGFLFPFSVEWEWFPLLLRSLYQTLQMMPFNTARWEVQGKALENQAK